MTLRTQCVGEFFIVLDDVSDRIVAQGGKALCDAVVAGTVDAYVERLNQDREPDLSHGNFSFQAFAE